MVGANIVGTNVARMIIKLNGTGKRCKFKK